MVGFALGWQCCCFVGCVCLGLGWLVVVVAVGGCFITGLIWVCDVFTGWVCGCVWVCGLWFVFLGGFGCCRFWFVVW